MTTKGNGREPSMDEIMAQIRSIIAADETKAARPPVARPSDLAGDRADADVLELTDMVNDDGSVSKVENPAGGTAAKPQSPGVSAASAPAGDFGLSPQPPADLQPVFTSAAAASPPPAPQAPRPAPPAPASAPQPAPAAPKPQPAAQAAPAPIPAAPPKPAMPVAPIQPMVQTVVPPPMPQSAPQPAMPPSPAAPSSQPRQAPMSDLLSNAAAGAAATALERLAAVNQQQQAPKPAPTVAVPGMTSIGGRSVEDVVMDALRPMLKQWLDANLPQLVERMVAQEIAKITKR